MNPQPACPKAGIYLAISFPTPVPHFAHVGTKKLFAKCEVDYGTGTTVPYASSCIINSLKPWDSWEPIGYTPEGKASPVLPGKTITLKNLTHLHTALQGLT